MCRKLEKRSIIASCLLVVSRACARPTEPSTRYLGFAEMQQILANIDLTVELFPEASLIDQGMLNGEIHCTLFLAWTTRCKARSTMVPCAEHEG